MWKQKDAAAGAQQAAEGEAKRLQTAPEAGGKPPNPNELRDHLANQRTLLAWVRTAITIMAFGFVIARFGILVRELGGHAAANALRFSALLGAALVATGALALVLATVRFVRVKRSIERQELYFSAAIDLVVAGIIVILGIVLAVYLLWSS